MAVQRGGEKLVALKKAGRVGLEVLEAKEDFEIVEQEFLIILQKALQDEDRDIQLKRERIDTVH